MTDKVLTDFFSLSELSKIQQNKAKKLFTSWIVIYVFTLVVLNKDFDKVPAELTVSIRNNNNLKCDTTSISGIH